MNFNNRSNKNGSVQINMVIKGRQNQIKTNRSEEFITGILLFVARKYSSQVDQVKVWNHNPKRISRRCVSSLFSIFMLHFLFMWESLLKLFCFFLFVSFSLNPSEVLSNDTNLGHPHEMSCSNKSLPQSHMRVQLSQLGSDKLPYASHSRYGQNPLANRKSAWFNFIWDARGDLLD